MVISKVLKDIISAQSIAPYQIHIRFEDGIAGTIDLRECIKFEGIFAALQDPNYCATVQINPEIGTLVWGNGADLDPDVLYSMVSGQPIPTYDSPASQMNL
jgi:Protein of unknown function (DUF2442)